MSHEGLEVGTFLQEFGTGHIEWHAHPGIGLGSFYILSSKVVDGFPQVFQIRWDPVDYMAVARSINPMNGADTHFHFFFPMDRMCQLGDDIWLARRGRNEIQWEVHGAICKILFDRTVYNPAHMPPLLEADAYPPSPADTD